MQLCKDCYVPMIGVMSFSKDKHEKFCRCPKCRGETKHRKLREEELSFREEIKQRIKCKVVDINDNRLFKYDRRTNSNYK